MGWKPALCGVLMVLLLASCESTDDANQVYTHPTLGIGFTASPGWTHGRWPSDPGVYEAVDQQSIVHVVLWHTETEQDALGYLLKMADMKGLAQDSQPEQTAIAGHEAWVLDTTGRHEGGVIRTLLAVIPHGRVESRPKENFLLIAQLWCPEGSSTAAVASMREILSTLRISD